MKYLRRENFNEKNKHLKCLAVAHHGLILFNGLILKWIQPQLSAMMGNLSHCIGIKGFLLKYQVQPTGG